MVAIGVFKIRVVVLSCVDSSKRLQEINLDNNGTGCVSRFVTASDRTYLVELSLIKSWLITFMIIYAKTHICTMGKSRSTQIKEMCSH